MYELMVAVGLVFVIEGLVWALFPNTALRVFEAAKDMPEFSLRIMGALSVLFGVLVVWFVRGGS